MKVAHITPAFFPALVYGGPMHSLHGLCLGLASAGHDVRVLTTDANGLSDVLDVARNEEVRDRGGYRIRYCHRQFRHSVSGPLLAHLSDVVRWADVVHLTAVYNFTTLPALAAARTIGRPVVWSPRGALQRWSQTRRQRLKWCWEVVCKSIAPGQLLLHVTSDDEADDCGKRLPGVRSIVVPNGIAIPPSLRRVPGDHLRLTFLGRLDRQKGIENLIEACGILESEGFRDWTLRIAGGGDAAYAASLLERIVRSGVDRRVSMIGAVEGESKEQLFETTDILVFPSHLENFGVVVTEALARGIPVIASRGTPWRELERQGCGWWVDNSPPSLAAAIRTAHGMPFGEMGARGRRWVAGHFAWPVVTERMVKLYRSAMEMG